MFSRDSKYKPRPAWARYGVAVGCVVLGWLAREGLRPAAAATALPFVFFFPPAALAAWYGGFGPGALATLLGAGTTRWFFIEPLYSFKIENTGTAVGLAAFVVSSLFIVAAIEAMHRARARVVVELAERERVELTLREKEKELETIIGKTPFMLTRCSRDLRYLFVSRAYAEMIERRPEDVAGKRIVEVMGERGFETIRPHVEAVLRGERVEYEAGVEFHKVGVRQLSVVYVPDVDAHGQVIGWVASIRDVTQVKQAEQALRDSERRERERASELAVVLDGVPTPVFIVHDASGTHITGNRAADEFLRNRRGGEASLTAPDERKPRHFKAVKDGRELRGEELPAQRAARGEVVKDFELSVVFEDGAVREVAAHATPLFDERGRPRGAVHILVDVTERKAFQAELERLVSERTAKLQELVGELEHFSYTITHDMRAPLRAMRAFAEMLNQASERLGEEERAFVGRIIAGAERMDALIQDALSYSKAVRTELPLGPVDVGKLLRGMLDTYPQFQAAQAEITVERNLPWVMGNEAGLTQCFSNLLDNAVKFVRPGERARVHVKAEVLADGQHACSYHANGHQDGWVRLWVEDEGIGISKEMLPRVFDMFAHGSSPQSGTGIGLALVRKVVDRMGGKVGLESEPGRGSRVWLELKAGDVNSAAVKAARAAKGI